MLKARAGLGNALDLHWRSSYQAAAMRGSAQRQCRCLKFGHDASELAKRHGVHPNQIYGWKKQVLDNVASLFARGASALGDGEEEHERETAKLYTKIGQLTVERDFLARRPGR